MKKNSQSHITFDNDGNFFCRNCGEKQELPNQIQVTMYVAMSEAFMKIHKNCDKTWQEPTIDQTTDQNEREKFWLNNGERGISSNTMFKYLNHFHRQTDTTNGRESHPRDPADFRRCYLLLKMIPEFKNDLNKMDKVSIVWKNLVDNWSLLTTMLERAMDPKSKKDSEMFELMKSLGCNG